MGKRGVIEIQFNWILVLVVGAAVMIVFIGFISNQQGLHELSTDILTANSLGSIFSSYGNKDSSNVVEMPKSRIGFDCDSFSVDGISKQLGALSLFSPSSLETDKLNLLSFGWDIPYRADNFVYIASPGIRYIFIGNSDFAREIFEKMRGKTRADGFTNIQVIEDENDAAVRIIFFDQNPEIPESLKASESAITSLKVDGDKNNGLIEFFELADGRLEPRGKSYYLKEELLLGAIFSDDADRYNCAMGKAFNKLRIISQIYQEKINNVTQRYIDGKNQICADFYQNNLLRISNSLSVLSSFDSQSRSYEGLIEAANELEKINNEADDLSCALIY